MSIDVAVKCAVCTLRRERVRVSMCVNGGGGGVRRGEGRAAEH